MRYPAALEMVRERVKPERDENETKAFASIGGDLGGPRRDAGGA